LNIAKLSVGMVKLGLKKFLVFLRFIKIFLDKSDFKFELSIKLNNMNNLMVMVIFIFKNSDQKTISGRTEFFEYYSV
jgi:hypothetical protein